MPISCKCSPAAITNDYTARYTFSELSYKKLVFLQKKMVAEHYLQEMSINNPSP